MVTKEKYSSNKMYALNYSIVFCCIKTYIKSSLKIGVSMKHILRIQDFLNEAALR